jgi:DNA polymerase I-like protein with 3'-5' exonuclease and polymerase domains
MQTNKIGGFKFIPKDSSEVAIGGFTTAGQTIERLEGIAGGSAREFLAKINRSNSISTYLSTFIGGIRKGLRQHDVLHTSFMQCVTSTGRLSARLPNFHNMPRANTFPVRKVVVSRFEGGKILEGDFKQLEFRIAGELSNDKQIFEDVIGGLDVHAATAEWTKLSRQDSKPFTFRPVYGGTDRGQPEHIARYIRYFQDRYKGLFKAHIEWQNEVLNTGSYKIPSGREFIFPNTVRYASGGISNSTSIANYKVQSFSTADLVPISVIKTWKLFKEYTLKSIIILTVHDSIEIDCHPEEIEICKELLQQGMNCLVEECLKRYNYNLQIPIESEFKIGDNWLNMKDI